MKYSEYEKAFSPARLNKYLVACGGNTAKALPLYRHNVKLCQRFYGILNIFEVVLRIIAMLRQNGRYTNDRVVSSVSFGFWTHLFTRQPFRLGGQNLLRIFPNRTAGLGQRAVFNELQEIKTFFGYQSSHLFYGIDILPDSTIAKIEALK